ncbi:MAG: histidine kinase [Spirochaetales bacterium]|nr:histidine kinase [Spirochaetales bacterium]
MRSNSLRSRLALYYIMSMGVAVFFLAVIMLFSLEIRRQADRQFLEEQRLMDLQDRLSRIQEPLLSYLSSRSSSALSELLILSEGLKGGIPEEKPLSRKPEEQFQREIYFLVEAYLAKVEEAISEKRGRNITAYTESYEFLQDLYSHINNRIDMARLTGFHGGMENFQAFMLLFGRMQKLNLLLMLSGAGMAFSLLLIRVDRITRPMFELSLMAEYLSRNEFDQPDRHFDSVDEVNRVAEAFNDMKHNIHHYIKELEKRREVELRNMKMEQMLKKMELYTMQAQMNPHFLFNTINTGVQLAIMEEAERTGDFMESLANLFRHNLRDKQFFVPLRHERDGLTSYLEILRIRFSKTRDFEMNIPEEYLDRFTVPAMIIQPLVENSVVHAFKDYEGRARVNIQLRFEKPYLVFSVKDNGSGIPQRTVERLLEKHAPDYSMESKVMGLDNVIQRLYFFYPEERDIVQIFSNPGEGTEIVIRINTEVEPCMTL